jgi:urease accessory protein
MRGERPFLFTNLKDGVGLEELTAWVREKMAAPAESRARLVHAGDQVRPAVHHSHPH